MRLNFKINWLLCCSVVALFGCKPVVDPEPATAPSAPAVSQQTSQNPRTTTANASAQTTAVAITSSAATKPWWQDAVVYQIWPRSFADSNKDGHGDFAGIQSKLPYLQTLGVDAIWLTPIFEAPSYHGYDFTEFYQVEQDYGTMAQFEALLADAKSRNIRIILDLVINHISDRHDWFMRSAKGEAPFKDYFIWRSDLPTDGWGPAWDNKTIDPKVVWHYHPQRKQYYYAAFGASQPDLNLQHPDVIAEMKKMAKFWLDKGVTGFRLDAVRYAIENGPGQQADTSDTMQYWQDFSAYVRSIAPDTLLVGEAWADLPVAAQYYGDGKALDAGFDFDFGYKVLALLQSDGAVKAEFGTMQGSTNSSQQPLQANYADRLAAKVPMGYFSPFLTNHDQPRVGWQLGGHQAKAKLAAAMLFASPGTSYVYYGEEIGLTQASDAEHIQRRAPMLWDKSHQAGFTTAEQAWVQSADLFPSQQSTGWWAPFLTVQLSGDNTLADQQKQPKSLWHFYKTLIQLKKQRPEFSVAGSYQALAIADGALLQLTRELNGQKTVFLLNMTAKSQPIPAELLQDNSLQTLWSDNDLTVPALDSWQLRIWQN